MKDKRNCEKCNDTAFRFYEVESRLPTTGMLAPPDAYTMRFELCTCVAARLYIERLKRKASQFKFINLDVI